MPFPGPISYDQSKGWRLKSIVSQGPREWPCRASPWTPASTTTPSFRLGLRLSDTYLEEDITMDPKNVPRPLSETELRVIVRIGLAPFSSQPTSSRMVGAPDYHQPLKATAKAK